MKPIQYHDGQRDVQREANSMAVADNLSTWVGPVADFARIADLIVMASVVGDEFRVGAISGTPPLVSASKQGRDIAMEFPLALGASLGTTHPWGGIVINLAQARRSRIAGTPIVRANAIELPCEVAFTNCRKYMTPTSGEGTALLLGPSRTEPLSAHDAWIGTMLANAETSFLVTATPSGVADVSHRGGRPGYLRYDEAAGTLGWTEYLGDGMFVSTGNVRQRNVAALIVLDFASGDALHLDLVAAYTNLLSDRHERVDALVQANEPYPVQGRMHATIRSAERLVGFCYPRRRAETREAINSSDTTAVQHPQ